MDPLQTQLATTGDAKDYLDLEAAVQSRRHSPYEQGRGTGERGS